jgi:DNA-directed RNA polymerase subunit K/omega
MDNNLEAKKHKMGNSAITRNLSKFDKDTDNIYEAVAIMSKRANQISLDMKNDFHEKVHEVVTPSTETEGLEEIFENKEQIDLGRYFEQLPKPVIQAIYEFEHGKTHYKRAAK